MTDDNSHDAWRRSLQTALAAAGPDPARQLERLQQVRLAFQQELAAVAEPAFNAVLRSRDEDDLEVRRELASWANELLRSLNLAVRCGRTGRPATIVIDSRGPEDASGRFRLELRDADGRVIRTLASKARPEFSLMPDPPRTESMARSYRRRTGDEPSR
jgi:hypothetical protein